MLRNFLRSQIATALVFTASACHGADAQTPTQHIDGPGWSYFRLGNPNDIQTPTRPGIVFEGGGKDVNDAYKWMCKRSRNGDFLVIRTTGTNAYNPYIQRLCPAINSASTLIITSKRGAGDPFVRKTMMNAEALFIEASVEGFSLQAQPRPRALLAALARIAHAREDTSMFVARIDGRVAGSAGLSVMETPRGRVGELYIASTLPAFRGRGVQTALLQARLAAARDAGCALVFVGARPANTSARNVERAGFGLAFTKATFARACPA